MKRNILIAFLAFLFSAQVSQAAPAPWGLALNHETKECAGYWAGDEFVDYKLPEGWKAYYPTYDNPDSRWEKIKTEAGECSFQISKEEACCMELGYRFVSDNIGKGQKTILRDREEFEKALRKKKDGSGYLMVVGIPLSVIVGIFILVRYLKKKRKDGLLDKKDKNNQ